MPFGSGHLLYIVAILVIVGVIWGPGKLPELGGAMGRAIAEFKNALGSSSSSIPPVSRPSDPSAIGNFFSATGAPVASQETTIPPFAPAALPSTSVTDSPTLVSEEGSPLHASVSTGSSEQVG